MDAGLALDRLEQHRRGALADGRVAAPPASLATTDEAGHERRERRLLGLLRRRRQRAVGAAVEAVAARRRSRRRAGAARELDRRLVRLGAGVAEEHLAAERALRQAWRRAASRARCSRGCVTWVSSRPARWIAATTPRVAVPDVEHRDPGEEVEVLVAVGVPQPHAAAAHELDRVADVGADRVARARAPGAPRQTHARRTSGRIIVPCPASVNSSSSSECGTRPSTMCADADAAVGPRRGRPRASAACRRRLRRAPLRQLDAVASEIEARRVRAGRRSQPATSVRNMTLYAPARGRPRPRPRRR